MNKQNLEKALKVELQSLNEQIDAKIIRGLSYSKESHRHKLILASISHLRREMRLGWFDRFTFA